MKVNQIVIKQFKPLLYLVIILGTVNSLAYTGLLIIINSIVSNTPIEYFDEYKWALFVLFLLTSIIGSKLFQSILIKRTNNTFYEIELSILGHIKKTTFEAFEKIGIAKVYTAIEDSQTLRGIPGAFTSVFNAALIVLCGLIYLFWISYIGAISLLIVLVILISYYTWQNNLAEKDFNDLRDLQNEYHRYLKDLLNGFKEFKMHDNRNDSLFRNFLEKNRTVGNLLRIKAANRYLNNELIGNNSWYILLGIILFVFPNIEILESKATSSFIITILYIMGPIGELIGGIPFYTTAKVALERLNKFEEDLTHHDLRDKYITVDDIDFDISESDFNTISFRNVVYQYYGEESEKKFKFGPIDFDIEKGELVFITGGNGSGKSTFLKILTGLYQTKSGDIYVDDHLLKPENHDKFFKKMSAIFTDNYLFSENYDGYNLNSDNKTFVDALELMKLSDVIPKDNGDKAIAPRLSKGQQKRLSFIYMLLENRQILILDEWAAEQDPVFRKYFYEDILQGLKNSNKTVIVVTHDDHYFSVADRVVKFDFGKIVNY